MKRLVALVLSGSLITLALVASAETKPSDQKWLETVEKMVAKGEHKVSTPKEERVSLLKKWGKENGYTVKVTKTETGYKIELAKDLAQR